MKTIKIEIDECNVTVDMMLLGYANYAIEHNGNKVCGTIYSSDKETVINNIEFFIKHSPSTRNKLGLKS